MLYSNKKIPYRLNDRVFLLTFSIWRTFGELQFFGLSLTIASLSIGAP